ncbi:MAG: hypothetical protein LBG92_12375, partial [Prevotellaceae bacterium]|nr:hypothetical protein [Prevotellaceae bacterium]
MKASKYLYFVERDGKALCYSTLHNTMIAMSSKACNDFKTGDMDEFKIIYPNTYMALVENKLIVEDSADELAEIRLRNKMEAFGNRHFDLTVLPTMDCNLHCWYCFEDHVPDSRMSKAVQERILTHIRKK